MRSGVVTFGSPACAAAVAKAARIVTDILMIAFFISCPNARPNPTLTRVRAGQR
jgi:hypothetical protein